MSEHYATPILYLNMGGEMLYVLQQRLQTQRISPDKTVQVMCDVIYALLNPKQLQLIFEVGPPLGLISLRPILERVILSSIMKLDGNSMNKLFDLMIMMVKYQLATATGPRELLLSTLNHLDAIRDMATMDSCLGEHVDRAHRLVVDTYGNMSHKDVWQLRSECLQEIQEHSVRVSILLRLGMQNQDASFNRLVQRYDEKYEDRRQILEGIRLLDYSEDESVMGSLALFGDRVTLLGKNVYSSTYGHVHSSRSNQNLQQALAVSNKSMRRELECLATQLGKEEAIPNRPFSLHLFTNDNDKNNTMDCEPDNSKFDDEQYGSDDVALEDEEGNLSECRNRPVNEYRDNLVQNVNSEFADNDTPPRLEAMDLVNLLDVM